MKRTLWCGGMLVLCVAHSGCSGGKEECSEAKLEVGDCCDLEGEEGKKECCRVAGSDVVECESVDEE